MGIQKTFIITGMHRSGTSMLANWFQKSGLNIGEKLIEPHPSNPDGHFEDVDFVNLHNIAVKYSKTYLFTKDIKKDIKQSISVALQPILSNKNSSNKVWGFKDPRTCIFLDLYNESIKHDKCFVFIFRNYKDALSSYLNRELVYKRENLKTKFIPDFLYRLLLKRRANTYINSWIYHNQKILELIEQEHVDFVLIDFDDLETKPEVVRKYLDNHIKEINFINFETSILRNPLRRKIEYYNEEAETVFWQLKRICNYLN